MISIDVCKMEPNPACVCDICDLKIVEYNFRAMTGDKCLVNLEFCDDCFAEFTESCEIMLEE